MQEKEIVIFVVVIVVVIILLNRKNEQENFVWTGYPGAGSCAFHDCPPGEYCTNCMHNVCYMCSDGQGPGPRGPPPPPPPPQPKPMWR